MKGYIALVHKDEGTSYGVSFPDVPGCIAAGDTFEEAVALAAEALAGPFGPDAGRWRFNPRPPQLRPTQTRPEFLADADDAIVTMVTPQPMPAKA